MFNFFSQLKPSTSQTVRLLVIGAMFALVLAGPSLTFFRQLDHQLLDGRFRMTPRHASGEIVYLAVDKKTLDAVGTWPWPRSVYARLLEKLAAFGVDDIFLDIDFSTPSVMIEDESLAQALANAGGGVILPVFQQHLSADQLGTPIVTRPLKKLAANAWLAFANVSLDEDGSIRQFQLGDILDGQPTQSVAAALGRSQRSSGSALIDYSIQPSTVPTLSLTQIMEPSFDGAFLHGRSVVIGAYATELKDIFPVPVYGQLSGPMLHILAAETLAQKRLLTEFDQLPLELAFAAIVIAAAMLLRAASSIIPVVLALAIAFIMEGAAIYLQVSHALVIHTAVGLSLVLFGLALTLTEKVDFSRFLTDLANSEQRTLRRLLRKIVADSTDAVLAFDHKLMIFESSSSAGPMLGKEGTDYRGKMLADLVPEELYRLIAEMAIEHALDPRAAHASALQFTLTGGASVTHLDANVTLSPVERLEEVGRSSASFVGSLIIRDITARRLYEDRLRYLSEYDELTGLMNRRMFSEHVRGYAEPVYILAIGLHRLSVVNATMGRDFGDEVLRSVAGRLKSQPLITSAARLGGDVFVVAVPQYAASCQADAADHVMEVFKNGVTVAGSQIHINVRLGICTYMIPGEAGDLWIERAEHALDHAKLVAGSGWCAYDQAAAQQQHQARELEHAMRHSLSNDEFFLLYQPQVNLRTGQLEGAEALLRWRHPVFGLVSPSVFIPIAEANGFVCELGQWALAEACREAAKWPEALSIAVNVAPVQLIRTDIVADVKRALISSGLSPARLHLELTESGFVEQSGSTLAAMDELRKMGILIALDDFGTGYSSLSYMAGFPLDKLKIDQSFVRRITDAPQSLAIVQTIKALATGLGLAVVAEGVETLYESQLLAAMGCEVGQGYYFGKPQSASELVNLLVNPPWKIAA